MYVFIIILFILSIIACYFSYRWTRERIQEDNITKIKNQQIQEEYKSLQNKYNLLNNEYQHQQEKVNDLKNITDNMNETANRSFEQYCDILENNYTSKEKEYKELEEGLYIAYNKTQDELIDKYTQKKDELNAEAAQIRADLDKMKNTRAAAIQAKLNEEKIKDNANFYMLSIPIEDLNDAKILKDIEYKLHNPRTLRMLIWRDFYQKPMNNLCNNVLGPNTITGIYKITNHKNDMCYIGQAVDVATRWKNHAKAGLGIDTPVTSKLYPAMISDGLENFTFELLEECDANELNEKEKFFINLYESYEYGYNSNKRH